MTRDAVDEAPVDEAAPALQRLRDAGFMLIVVTNQPVIARGLCTESTLELIHNSLKRSIETEGGRLDAIYCCPHHPETQYDEGVKELRRGCDCRKPAPGMLERAAREHGSRGKCSSPGAPGPGLRCASGAA